VGEEVQTMALFSGVLLVGVALFLVLFPVLMRQRRHEFVYARNRESEPARPYTPQRFFLMQLWYMLCCALSGIGFLGSLHFALWAVTLFIVALILSVALVVANLRREQRRWQ
jgi:hypothetical protein